MLSEKIPVQFKKILKRLYNIQKVCFRIVGLEIFYFRKDYHYVPNLYGRSSVKQLDIRNQQPFGNLAKMVIEQGRCMLYYDRLYTLHQALGNLRFLVDEGIDICSSEVGVFQGGTSYFIASTLKNLGLSHLPHYAFDTFEGHSKLDINPEIEVQHKAGMFHETSYESVKNYLMTFGNISLQKGRIQDSSRLVTDKKFGFVHLDVDIYEPTIFSLCFFGDRLVSGGMIVVDDFDFVTCPGIVKAVDEFTAKNKNYHILKFLSGQCVLIKR